MNSTNLDQQLQISLDDVAGTFYRSTNRSVALLRATREFSRYKSSVRAFGQGKLFYTVFIGDNTATAAIGMWNVGDVVTVDAYTPQSENLTVQSISVNTPSISTIDTAYATPLVELTFTSKFIHFHNEGAFIEQTVPGLQLNVGQTRYALPPDLFKTESDSFDRAVGYKQSYVDNGGGYYDAIYFQAQRYNSTGIGMNYNFTSGGLYGYENGLPTTYNNSDTAPSRPRYRFMLNDAPYLEIKPAPTITKRMNFDYFGCISIDDLQSSDSESVICYACYLLFNARAASINEGAIAPGGTFKTDDFSQSPHENAAALKALADSMLKQYQAKVQRIPILVSR